jgi:DNA-binding winged helix-turn-helix (wHTH) protein
MSSNGNDLYEFAGFRLDPKGRGLWREDTLVALPPKAVEVLLLLIERPGEIVSRDEVLSRVWADTFVEESNITYTISLLRKAIGDSELVKTVPKRGYLFTGEVTRVSRNGSTTTANVTPGTERPRNRSWLIAPLLALSALVVVAYFAFSGGRSGQGTREPGKTLPEAEKAYTRGKMILESKSVEDREQKAIGEFQQAILLDPAYARAYAGLSEGFVSAAVKLSHPAASENYAKAKVAAEKALSLDANLAEGLLVRGWIKRNADWDLAGAEADLRKAIELDRSSALAHYRLSRVLVPLGKTREALDESNRAYEIDPVSEMIASGRFALLEANGDIEGVLQLAETHLKENRENSFAARAYATFLYHVGDFARAIEISEAEMSRRGGKNAFAMLSLLAASYRKIESHEKAEAALAQLENMAAKDTKALYSLAMNYAELGRHDDAIAALQRCLDQREERLLWIRQEPRFANLANDARFLEISKKVVGN